MSSSSTSASYRRVPQREGQDSTASGSSSEFETTAGATTNSRSRAERLEDKCVALGWVIAAVLLARWTNFFPIVWSDPRLNRSLLRVAGGGFTVAAVLFLYLTLYLPILLMTNVITYLVFVRALWPLWGFWAPLLSGTEIMGIVMFFHFVPLFGLC
eukprot:jgi/Psemu1/302361/fgenesh1_kg.67_\